MTSEVRENEMMFTLRTFECIAQCYRRMHGGKGVVEETRNSLRNNEAFRLLLKIHLVPDNNGK